MPTTNYYPAGYASEAARNLRELAGAGPFATTDPGTGPLMMQLREAATAMRQVLDQLATDHAGLRHPGRLRVAARRTGDELHQAGNALEAAHTHLAGAMSAAEQMTSIPTVPTREWVPVADLHGADAAHALDLLDRDGPQATVVFLSQWDQGVDTDDRAIDQGTTQEQLPLEPGDKAVSFDAYTIVADPGRGHIAMYRLLDDLPSPDILDAQDRHMAPPPPAIPTTSPATAAAAAAEPAPPEPPTRRSQRQQAPARHAKPPAPRGSWFDPPATGGGAVRGRGPRL